MKPGWGVGIVVAILLSAAVFLLNLVTLKGLVSLTLLLAGLWTIVSAFAIVERKERNYYSAWGVVIAALSLSYVIQFQYALALILLAIVALIVINVYIGKTPKMYEAATNPTPAGGGSPAAKAT